jgi:hypothetical protein
MKKQRLTMVTAESEYSPRNRLERCLADEESREADKRLKCKCHQGNKLKNQIRNTYPEEQRTGYTHPVNHNLKNDMISIRFKILFSRLKEPHVLYICLVILIPH